MPIVNCSRLFPEGHYRMQIKTVPEEDQRVGTIFWRFTFATALEGAEAEYQEFLPIWLCGPMFKALGCAEIKPGSFDVEPTMLLGKVIEGDVIHETIESGNKAGQVVSRLKNIKLLAESDIPF